MDCGPSCPGSSAPHLPATHPQSCLLSLLCTMDTVLTAQTCVLTTASIMSLVWCPCARIRQRSETSASSQETCMDGGVTCSVISPISAPTDLHMDWFFYIPAVSTLFWNELLALATTVWALCVSTSSGTYQGTSACAAAYQPLIQHRLSGQMGSPRS